MRALYARDPKFYAKVRERLNKAQLKAPVKIVVDKSLFANLSTYKYTFKDFYNNYKSYENTVRDITEDEPLYLLRNIDKRGFTGWHIDHIISIRYGFINQIPPYVIASLDNLQMIHFRENMDKGNRCYSVIESCNHIKERYYAVAC
jgi:hypothetical protein